MLIVPAIDLKGGKCVRLLRGEMNAETVYGDDPVAVGQRWVSEGAQYLHVVDLDGAVSGAGGERRGDRRALRGAADSDRDRRRRAQRGARRGVARAWCRPRHLRHRGAGRTRRSFARRAERFPGRIAVGIDARDGKVAVQGWTETSGTTRDRPGASGRRARCVSRHLHRHQPRRHAGRRERRRDAWRLPRRSASR